MKTKILISGNEAMAEGAIQAGCRFYAGYPITPQNELTAYMAKNMPACGGEFIQAESELAAINMVYGASAAGARAMTSSSSPGISLKQEGISYIAGALLPAVIVNIMRGGPGLGNIWPAQSDYFQATRGGGHGDYRTIVLAPSSVQEAYDFMPLAFDLADKYLMPAMILADGMLGQMMEPLVVVRRPSAPSEVEGSSVVRGRNTEDEIRTTKKWALTGCKGRPANVVKSFFMKEGALEIANLKAQKKYRAVENKEQRWEGLFLDDAKIILVAYGSMSRIAKSVVVQLRQEGKKAGLIRPVTLWPFPRKIFEQLSRKKKRPAFFVTEMSYGQMVEDVKLALECRCKVDFFGRSGGGVPTEGEIIKKVRLL
ncbi:MAG: 3-methyl-2-oxobutanoate dehydrogenase subunit VorB [Candidatus Omnitrophota bacterium]|nr:3-methyl-2-oxobutanoate dehydrogenase subunit VorB [Candidatus Omnitrophota bacterium]